MCHLTAHYDLDLGAGYLKPLPCMLSHWGGHVCYIFYESVEEISRIRKNQKRLGQTHGWKARQRENSLPPRTNFAGVSMCMIKTM